MARGGIYLKNDVKDVANQYFSDDIRVYYGEAGICKGPAGSEGLMMYAVYYLGALPCTRARALSQYVILSALRAIQM